MPFKTPILFIVFNRPDTTAQVFERIREIQPEHLYIAADGPRIGNTKDQKNCPLVREIVSKIDWQCETHTLFQDKNLGCHTAVPAAITWFFSNVPYGIILEDDCLPDPTFFQYCEELLVKYQDNPQIMMISGDNFTHKVNIQNSYDFSKYAFIWGWASWKRAWDKFDNKMTSYKKLMISTFFIKQFNSILEWMFWMVSFYNKYTGKKEGWDSKWIYALIANKGVSVVPQANLVTNLGFTPDATATFEGNADNHVMPTNQVLFPLKHPSDIIVNKAFDDESFQNVFLTTVSLKSVYKNFFPARGKI